MPSYDKSQQAVEKLGERIKKQYEEIGRPVSSESAHREAAKVARDVEKHNEGRKR